MNCSVRMHRGLDIQELEARVAPAVVVQDIPYAEDFSSGLPTDTDGWEYYSTANGRIRVVDDALLMDSGTFYEYALNEAILHINLDGQSNIALQFQHQDLVGTRGDEPHAMPTKGTAWTGHWNGDGVAMSADGGTTWYTLTDLGSSESWTTYTFFLDLEVYNAGIGFSSDFLIKFQQYDDYPDPYDGRQFDNIVVGARPGQTVPYSQDFSDGMPGWPDGWEYYSTTDGRIQVQDGALLMDKAHAYQGYALNEAILHVNLVEMSDVRLRFDHKDRQDGTVRQDEPHAMPEMGTGWEGHWNGDGVAVSADGGATWYTIADLGSCEDWTTYVVDLDAAIAGLPIGYTEDFLIKFQQYDDYMAPYDGRRFDNIIVDTFPRSQDLPYSQDFSEGKPPASDGWEYYSTSTGRICVGEEGTLVMDTSVTYQYALNEAILYLDLQGESHVQLQFDHQDLVGTRGDEPHAMPEAGTAWSGHWNGDGVAMSADGGMTWYTLTDLGSSESWTTYTIDLDAATAEAGIGYTSRFMIKFQQYDDYPRPYDGREFDNMAVYRLEQAQALNYSQDFSDGLPNAVQGWDYYSTGAGRVRVEEGALLMDTAKAYEYALNEAVLHLNLAGQTGVQLQFDHQDLVGIRSDEPHAMPAAGSGWAGHWNGDGVAMSADGGLTWYTLSDLGSKETWTTYTIDLDAATSAVGIGYTSDFLIKFQQYDDYPSPYDGRQFDNITVTATTTMPT